jgi:hypothetical protein
VLVRGHVAVEACGLAGAALAAVGSCAQRELGVDDERAFDRLDGVAGDLVDDERAP